MPTLDDLNRKLTDLHTEHSVLKDKITQLQHGYEDLKRGQAQLSEQLTANTVITTQVKDLLTAGKIGTQILKWVASLVISYIAIAQFLKWTKF